jgi:secreted Zn-dependent insulinase-like peptidase
MALFAQKICAALQAYKPDAATFNRQKESFLRELSNFNTQQPISHSFYYANLALESGRYTVEETTAAVQRLTLHDLEDFLQLNFGRSYGKALVVGNIDAVGAEKLVNIVQEALPFTALPQGERFKTAITILPTVRELNSEHTDHSTGGLRTSHPEPNAHDINSAASLYFHLPNRLPEDYMIVELLAEVLEQQFYSSLRTQQQLGYLVYANAGKREGVRSITFCVQSAIVDGAEITRRIEAFIANEMPAFLARLTETELEVYKQGLIGRRLEPDQRLTAQAGRFWAEIASQSVPDIVIQRDATEVKVPAPRFDRRQTEVEFLRKITLSELRTFAHEFLSVGGAKRRVLVSQVTSQIPVPANKGASVADEAKEAVVVGREGVAAASDSSPVPDKLEVRYREIGGQEQSFRQSSQTI